MALNEGFFDSIAKLLTMPKIDSILRKAKKLVEEDPDLASSLDSMNHHREAALKKLDSYCKRNPNSPECTGKKSRSKSRVRSVKY